MNTKLLSLLSATVALAFSTGFLASAEAKPLSSSPSQPILAQAQPNLNLTTEQQSRIRQIQQSTQTQIESVLTAEQKNKIKTGRERGENPRQIFASLNLTQEQQARLKQIMQTSQQQMESVLTPAQRQQLQQLRQNGGGQPR